LLAGDFKAGQLPAGAQGATGPSGPAGAQGAKGDKGDPGPANPLTFAAPPLLTGWDDTATFYNTNPVGTARTGSTSSISGVPCGGFRVVELRGAAPRRRPTCGRMSTRRPGAIRPTMSRSCASPPTASSAHSTQEEPPPTWRSSRA
jgi:hypothetical protein